VTAAFSQSLQFQIGKPEELTLIDLRKDYHAWEFCVRIARNGRMKEMNAFADAQPMFVPELPAILGGVVRIVPSPAAFVGTSL
jgi:hypothetical protein